MMKRMAKNHSLKILKSNTSLTSLRYEKPSSVSRNVRGRVECSRNKMLKKQSSSYTRFFSSKASMQNLDDSNLSFSDVKRAIYGKPRKAHRRKERSKRIKSKKAIGRKKSIGLAEKARDKTIKRLKGLCFSEQNKSPPRKIRIRKDPSDLLKSSKRKGGSSRSRSKMSFKKKVARQVKLNFKGKRCVKVEKVPRKNLNGSYLRLNSKSALKKALNR